jgi:predicted MPP superfamily phosphohydrolase
MPSDPIRWLHLSDFHVGKDGYESRKLFDRIHEHVREQCANGFVPDLIFITGDIANAGLEAEYAEFIAKFLEPLKTALGGNAWHGQVFAVPGNHDMQRIFVEAISREKRQQDDTTFFRANKEGREERGRFEVRAFNNFGDFTILTDAYDWLDSEQGTFAKTIDLRGLRIGIAGVNTAWLSRDDKDERQLSPGIDLVESALKVIKDCDMRILLGHHPIDWFFQKDRTLIQNRLGDSRVLYLHGHLHDTRCQPLDTGGGKFLQIQCGAAFRVKEGDKTKWRNGLLWAEGDSSLSCVRLQPKYWKESDGRWGIADDLHEDLRTGENWWAYPLPGTGEFAVVQEQAEAKASITSPEGWNRVDDRFLKERSHKEPSIETFLLFFDGAVPIWNRDFLHAIPPRHAVQEAIETLQKQRDAMRPAMVLLSGASGEGKSTALLQTALALFESGAWNVLWHASEKAVLPLETIQRLPSDKPWVIVSDDAEHTVDNLSGLLRWLIANRGGVHFLLAARSSDWYAAGATKIAWSQHCLFREITLGKLEYEEARKIVKLWSGFGEVGLKALTGTDPAEAARRLEEASTDELGEGALLGAMLKVRMAAGLKDHVKLLLSRLSARKINKGRNYTLLDAFAPIAFMHAEGLSFFSAPVLAQYIYGDPLKSVKSAIVNPLGKEAAANTGGSFLYTRHRLIAEAAAELLEKDFGVDPEEVFRELGIAAQEARPYAYIPEFKKWEYDYPKHFVASGRGSTGFAISRAQLQIDPGNSRLLTNLANLYREAGDPEESVRLFRTFEGNTRDARGHYSEWGTSEGAAGGGALSVWLLAASLSDWHFVSPPDNDRSKIGLAGLGVAFGALYDSHHDTTFRDARGACGMLGLTLHLDDTTRGYLDRYYAEALRQGMPKVGIDQAFEALERGITATWERFDRDGQIARRIPSQADMRFDGLKNLVRRASERAKS